MHLEDLLCGNLIRLVLGKLGHVERRTVVPVGLHDAFRTTPVELVSRVPCIVAPHPRTHPILLHLLGKEVEVVPPQIALTGYYDVGLLLADRLLLVHSDVEEARMVEYLRNVADDVGAEVVILPCRDHAFDFAHPPVVTRREIHFRNRLDAKRLESRNLCANLLDAPAAIDRHLWMAWIHNALGEVDNDHVHADDCHAVGYRPPFGILAPELGVVGTVCDPHVVAEVDKVCPDRSIGGTRLCTKCRHRGGSRRHSYEFSSVHSLVHSRYFLNFNDQ